MKPNYKITNEVIVIKIIVNGLKFILVIHNCNYMNRWSVYNGLYISKYIAYKSKQIERNEGNISLIHCFKQTKHSLHTRIDCKINYFNSKSDYIIQIISDYPFKKGCSR